MCKILSICFAQTKDNTFFTFRICKIADNHLPQCKKKTLAAHRLGPQFSKENQAHNHYFDKMHE